MSDVNYRAAKNTIAGRYRINKDSKFIYKTAVLVAMETYKTS